MCAGICELERGKAGVGAGWTEGRVGGAEPHGFAAKV